MHYSAKHALLAAQYPDATDHLQAPGSAEVSAALKLVEGEAEAKTWPQIRLKAMEKILRDKFQRCEEYRKKLKDTGDRDLVWENEEDTFWGATKGRGQNHLGRILMDVRKSIHEETDFHSWLFLCCELESDSEYYKLGKLPSNSVAALHPSISREHALILHSKLEVARPTGGVAIMDLGSKFGTHVDGRRLTNGFVLEPLKSSCKLKLGASTRSYEVRVNLRSQIEELERQQRELMREVQSIDQDAADPVQAAKRLAKEEATCFVGGLEYDTEKADLLGLFQDCGHVEEVRFPGQQEVGGKAVKGIAFVVFDSAMAARRACGLSGEMFKGRKLKVAPATDRPKGGVVLQAWDGGWIRSLAWTAAVL
ncbi:Riboflavin biosynthesis protein VVA0006 [Includes: Riboflavin biosynthesis intermediates N-glycosidase [Durusdinium trenchii]|uniref:Riboflavin biosynthesis protein VVA0006 n=1 Tax=Durusdinium trenchii TaxID=1381693 RepID=A0ABP0HMY5_9DINO